MTAIGLAPSGELREFADAMQELERRAAARGVYFRTADFGGVRTAADTSRILRYREQDYKVYLSAQAKAGLKPLAKEVWRPIAPFGKSFHNYGAARDVRPTQWPKGKTFQWAHDQLDAIVAADPKLGLRSGDGFNDEPHFELAVTLAEAQRRYAVASSQTAAVKLAGVSPALAVPSAPAGFKVGQVVRFGILGTAIWGFLKAVGAVT